MDLVQKTNLTAKLGQLIVWNLTLEPELCDSVKKINLRSKLNGLRVENKLTLNLCDLGNRT